MERYTINICVWLCETINFYFENVFKRYCKIFKVKVRYKNIVMICQIYKITSNQSNKIYIGKTKQKHISHRRRDHKHFYKKYNIGEFHYCSSFELLKYNDWKLELITKKEVENEDEIVELEQYYINQYRHDKNYEVVNINNPKKRTIEDIKKYQVEYREKNKEILKEKMKYINWLRNDTKKTKILMCEWIEYLLEI